jgi:hypothetical protein
VVSAGSHRILLGVLLAVVAVSGTAFAFTYGNTLAWQQRDAVEATATSYELAADGETMEIELTVENPLGQSITTSSVTMAVYAGESPYTDESLVTALRGATVTETTIGAQSEATVTVTVRVPDDRRGAAESALAAGNASASGSLTFDFVQREFTTDVGS